MTQATARQRGTPAAPAPANTGVPAVPTRNGRQAGAKMAVAEAASPALAANTAKAAQALKTPKAAAAAAQPNPPPTPRAPKVAKASAKPATQPPAKPPTTLSTKLSASPASVAAEAPTPADKAPRTKEKLVRDSFTMPRADYALIAHIKDRALGFRRPTKKSELLRAGLQALAALPDELLKAILDKLPTLPTGRPKKGH